MKRLNLWRYEITSTSNVGYTLEAWDRDGDHYICTVVFPSIDGATAEIEKIVKWNSKGVFCCGSHNWCEGKHYLRLPPLEFNYYIRERCKRAQCQRQSQP